MQIPLPQNCDIKLLFNGFCGYLTSHRKPYAAEVLVPEPGVLWGQFNGIPPPVLLSERPVEEKENSQWLESAPLCALLIVRDNSFCLVSKFHVFRDSEKLAEHYLADDFEAALQDELDRRTGVTHLFEYMKRHDELAVLSAECLMRGIREPDGELVFRWSQSPTSDTPLFSIDELYPLVLAWRHIDIAVAEELILCTLRLQANTGALPSECRPRGTRSSMEAPKPLIAQACELVWQVRRDPVFLEKTLFPLRRYIQWMLHHFDPKRRNLHCWQAAGEAFPAKTFESETASADLTALLLCEIDAFNRLQSNSQADASPEPLFSTERELLTTNLLGMFWNERTQQFSNAYVHGKITHLPGFPTFLPLLWPKLPSMQQSVILDQIADSDQLPGGQSILSWRKSAMEDRSFPLLQQVITLEALRIADAKGQLFNGFSQLTLEGFVEWHTEAASAQQRMLDPVTAAFILNLQETRSYGLNRGGRVLGFLYRLKQKTKTDRMDLAIILVVAFALLAMRIVYRTAEAPEAFETLKAQATTAYHHRNWEPALQNCTKIIKHYPDQSTEARLMAANILLSHGRPDAAEALFSYVRDKSPDSPGPMIGLGLAFQMQSKFKEADRQYEEFIYLFDDIFPELVENVKTYRDLSLERFATPPNWQNIYSYRIMHEL
ncbi:MAG: hypothetical protein K9M45_06300 [Kiritimatiellales bacterium]|nr:hypothetical protein [Kiritimatiellales bacterium]